MEYWHQFVKPNTDVGETVPDQMSEGDSRILWRLPERLGLDGSELVEVSQTERGSPSAGGVSSSNCSNCETSIASTFPMLPHIACRVSSFFFGI
jgi:hypothetical protein